MQALIRRQRGRFQPLKPVAERFELLAALRQSPVQQSQMGLQLLKARLQRRLSGGALFRSLRARFQRVHARFHLPELFVHGVQPRFHGGLQGAYLRQNELHAFAHKAPPAFVYPADIVS